MAVIQYQKYKCDRCNMINEEPFKLDRAKVEIAIIIDNEMSLKWLDLCNACNIYLTKVVTILKQDMACPTA